MNLSLSRLSVVHSCCIVSLIRYLVCASIVNQDFFYKFIHLNSDPQSCFESLQSFFFFFLQINHYRCVFLNFSSLEERTLLPGQRPSMEERTALAPKKVLTQTNTSTKLFLAYSCDLRRNRGRKNGVAAHPGVKDVLEVPGLSWRSRGRDGGQGVVLGVKGSCLRSRGQGGGPGSRGRAGGPGVKVEVPGSRGRAGGPGVKVEFPGSRCPAGGQGVELAVNQSLAACWDPAS